MKVIVLAAGYATRLYPLTLTRPKPLLPIGGQPMIEHVLEKLAPVAGIDRAYVVTNAKFAGHFLDWAKTSRPTALPWPITVVNDGTTDETNKLGAIGDLHFVLTREQVEDDLIVVAGDNLFSQSLEDFGRFGREKNAPVLAVYDVKSFAEVKKHSVVSVDGQARLARFEEKPAQPASTLAGIALYYYPRSVLPMIHRYIGDGHNPDQPGRLVQWLYPQTPVFAWPLPGLWFDIGSMETLEEANRVFGPK